MSRRDFLRLRNLPSRLTDEKLANVVQHLRTYGNTTMCAACKACALHGVDDFNEPVCLGIRCKNKGKTTINFIIETHVGLAIHIANKFRHRDKKDIVAVSLLSLTEAVNRYKNLHDNNISAYVTSCVVFGIRKYLQHAPLIRVPNDTYLKTRQTFKIDKQAKLVGQPSRVLLQLEVRNILAKISTTKYREQIIQCLLKGGYKKGEMAELCGVSNGRVSQILEEIETEFRRLWER